MIWHKAPIDPVAVKGLAARFGVDLLTATILTRRGLTDSNSVVSLLERGSGSLHNPFLLTDMDTAVDRIVSAIEESEIVSIFGDRDADGITASALMADYLISRELKPLIHTPVGDDPYGLTIDAVNEAQREEATLIICVDNGSSCRKAIEAAADMMIDVIVIDHHDVADPDLPAYAFVNPKRDDNYPNKGLCACALVSKTIFALDFALSGRLGQPCALIRAHMVDNILMVDTARVLNMKRGAEKRFALTGPRADVSGFVDCIAGCALYVYGSETIEILAGALSADVYATDLAVELGARFSALAKLSLEELTAKSRMLRHVENANPMDALFLLYCLSVTEDEESFSRYLDSFDLAAIGLVADMMPVLGENRALIRTGIDLINSSRRKSLTLMRNRLGLASVSVDATAIGWKLAPMLNAAGRMGESDKAVAALIEADFGKQAELLDRLESLWKECRRLSEEWGKVLFKRAEVLLDKYAGRAVLIYEERLPRGLAGLIASRLARAFKRPAVVMAARGPDEVSGSIRAGEDGFVSAYMERFRPLFISFGGHERAGGFSLKKKDVPKLESAFGSFVNALPTLSPDEEVAIIDAELNGDSLNAETIEMVKRLEPYGEGFAPLSFGTRGARVESLALIGKGEEHLKAFLTIGSRRWPAIKWGGAESLADLVVGSNVDISYKIKPETNSPGAYLEIMQIERSVHDS